MAVDRDGRVHVLMRGEDGSPVQFQRAPATGEWTREEATILGSQAETSALMASVTLPGDLISSRKLGAVFRVFTAV